MRRLSLLSSARCIAIADEALEDDPAARAEDRLASAEAFELVPLWQARPHGWRRLWAAVPVVAVAAVIALALGRDHDAEALRGPPATTTTLPTTSACALVVRAGPLPAVRAARSRTAGFPIGPDAGGRP